MSSPMQAAMTAGQVEADPLKPQIPEPPVGSFTTGAGDMPTEPVFVDYFGFEQAGEFIFPDKASKIYYRAMNEGDRAKFQRETNRDVQLERNTGNARIKTDQAGERKALILASCTGWNLRRLNSSSGQLEPVPFSNSGPGSTLAQWLDRADPKIVDALEEAIRKINPWLVGDMSLDDIDREMDRLRELREEKVKLEAEKDAFRG
jgi:hypothetical protein